MSELETTRADVQQGLAIVTHQIQGPLISAMGALSSIDTQLLPSTTRQRVLYSQALLEDALNICFGMFASFAQAMGTKISLQSEEITVLKDLKRLCERLSQTTGRSDLSFMYKGDSESDTIEMDRNIFTSVFYSLIHNAMKYADKDSTVRLESLVDRRSGDVTVSVKSKGQPISLSEREAVFERFTRGSAVRETGRAYSGVGLGLWIARQLMRASGGDLTLELSPSHPFLSVFVVSIPKTQAKSNSSDLSWQSLGIQTVEMGPESRARETMGGVNADVEEDPMVG